MTYTPITTYMAGPYDCLGFCSLDLDFVEEQLLQSLERELRAVELENKRLQAAQLKEEGNSLHKVGRIEDANRMYTDGLRICR